MTQPTIADADDDDLMGILSIYNDIVTRSTAMFSDEVSSLEERARWRAARQLNGYPVLVIRDESGVAGFASYGDFRPFSGFRYTVEHSIYVRADVQGRGFGGALMGELIDRAQAQGKKIMIAGVAAENQESIAFHERFGFVKTAEMPRVGYKFGRWLDLVFLQLELRPSRI